MSKPDQALEGTIYTQRYLIQNAATKRYLSLDRAGAVRSSKSEEAQTAMWDVHREDDGSYYFRNHSSHLFLDASYSPQNNLPVTSSVDTEYRWIVRERYKRGGKYIVYPKLEDTKEEYCWSFPKDSGENAEVLFIPTWSHHESAKETYASYFQLNITKEWHKTHAEWYFILASDSQSQNSTQQDPEAAQKTTSESKVPRGSSTVPNNSQIAEDSEKWMGATKLVLSVDIGTMQSAISFVYLERGKTPEIKHVTGWPCEPAERAKTLTAMFYDTKGVPCSFGADTESGGIKARAKSEEWTLVHSFKRHVHRLGEGVSAELSDDAGVQSLPAYVSELKLYTDWLVYLFGHAKQVVKNELANSGAGLTEVLSKAEVVFTVPNGWYTQEHALLSNAAVDARVVERHSAVRFVPETEAAVHWALEKGDLKSKLKVGTEFIVCDAGGSTTDIAMYKVASTSPLQLREKEGNPSKCIEAGSALINDGLNQLVREHLSDQGRSQYEIIEAQKKVAGSVEEQKVGFGSDSSKGTYKLHVEASNVNIPVTREKMEGLFNNVIEKIIAGIDDVMSNNKPQFLLLRGDFGCSAYFQDKLRHYYRKKMRVIPASEPNVKAAAAGALVWFQKRDIVSRAARHNYGVEINVPYNHADKEHRFRADGGRRLTENNNLRYGWSVLVPYGKVLSDGDECVNEYKLVLNHSDAPMEFETTIYLAEENVETKWLCDRFGNLEDDFREICTVKVDLSSQRGKLETHDRIPGHYYFPFKIALAFGSTKLEARVLWEGGSGPVQIIAADF